MQFQENNLYLFRIYIYNIHIFWYNEKRVDSDMTTKFFSKVTETRSHQGILGPLRGRRSPPNAPARKRAPSPAVSGENRGSDPQSSPWRPALAPLTSAPYSRSWMPGTVRQVTRLTRRVQETEAGAPRFKAVAARCFPYALPCAVLLWTRLGLGGRAHHIFLWPSGYLGKSQQPRASPYALAGCWSRQVICPVMAGLSLCPRGSPGSQQTFSKTRDAGWKPGRHSRHLL